LLRKENEKKELLRRQQEASSAPKKPAYTPTKRPSLPEKEQKSGFNGIIAVILLILLFGGLLLILPDNSDDSGNQNTVVPQSTEVIDSSLAAAEATSDKTTVFAGPQDGDNTYTNSIGMEFVLIPAGEFMMGSPSNEEDRYDDEGPVHEVTIGNAYYLGKYEVTQEQWVEIMGDNPSKFEGDSNPVECVSWDDVQEFVKKLNAKEGTDKYRLPTEAEWEYACRAGTATTYSFGDDESKLSDYVWYYENAGSKTTHPVGQKNPNPWGLYDMHGNVWEWCQDRWHHSYNGAPTDGSAWEADGTSSRVIRGGSWNRLVGSCYRYGYVQDSSINDLGFRIVREV